MLKGCLIAALINSLSLATTVRATEHSKSIPAIAAPSRDTAEDSFRRDWRLSKVVGLNVYNSNSEKIGSISDLLMDKAGKVKAAVISTDFPTGIERLIAVSFDKVEFSDKPIVANVGASGAASGGDTSQQLPSSVTIGPITVPAVTEKPDSRYPDHAVFNASKEELKDMPEFKFSAE